MKCIKKSDIQNLSDVLNIISQTNRLQIICLLNKETELCVNQITESLNLKQNLVSHHLNLLKNIGFLETRREGKNIYYSLSQKKYTKFKTSLQNIFSIL